MELVQLILLLGTIVGVTNGETIRVKDDAGQTATVRLACINTSSTQRLKELLPSGSPVVIKTIEKDPSGGIVGEVFVDNRSINLRLVEEGKALVDENTLSYCQESRTQFLIAGANAKNKRLGLWQKFKSGITKKSP